MKTFLILLTTFLFSLPSVTLSEELTPQKKRQIDDLLNMTGAGRLGEMIGSAFIQQMTRMLKQTNPDIDPLAFDLLKEEINDLIHDEVVEGNALGKLSYPIYHKYLTSADLEELIRFYNTPVGKKAIEIMPIVTQEAMQAGQVWGRSLGPKIQQRLNSRFKKEGITVQ